MDPSAAELQGESPLGDLSSPTGELNARSDRTLVDLVRGGRDDAATVLYARYASRLRALAGAQLSPVVASKVEPDDIVQSVFRSFFRRAVHGLYEVPRHEELWGLLLVSALNKIRRQGNYHRAAKRDARKTLRFDAIPEGPLGEEDPLALADLRMAIDDVLTRLPATHRPVVERRIAGEEVEEIANNVGRAKRSVERILHEFRSVLLASLAPPQDDRGTALS